MIPCTDISISPSLPIEVHGFDEVAGLALPLTAFLVPGNDVRLQATKTDFLALGALIAPQTPDYF